MKKTDVELNDVYGCALLLANNSKLLTLNKGLSRMYSTADKKWWITYRRILDSSGVYKKTPVQVASGNKRLHINTSIRKLPRIMKIYWIVWCVFVYRNCQNDPSAGDIFTKADIQTLQFLNEKGLLIGNHQLILRYFIEPITTTRKKSLNKVLNKLAKSEKNI